MKQIEIPDIGGAIIETGYIHLWMYGTLKSMRDKSLNKYREKRHNSRLIRAEQDVWLAKLQLLGVKEAITELFYKKIDTGAKMTVEATIHRQRPILDYKNVVGGFDHVILDGWVNAKIIKNDCLSYLDLKIDQISKKESEYLGRDQVFIRLK